MTQHRVVNEMGADELYNWIAADMLKDEKFHKKIKLSMQSNMTKEETSNAIKQMFMGLKNATGR